MNDSVSTLKHMAHSSGITQVELLVILLHARKQVCTQHVVAAFRQHVNDARAGSAFGSGHNDFSHRFSSSLFGS